ncbi:hypothetical protein VF21_06938 [Pseudogymnoascus sp. 05NY08]|nr:hypothetical protein VF21_06938 [Pseudogymnoascus sp. 05NY08]
MPSGNSKLQTVGRCSSWNIFIDKNFDAWVVDFRGGEGMSKGSGESSMNGFLETWTVNGIESLLMSKKVANIK